MATYSYKHAVKMGGKIIPANTEIKQTAKTAAVKPKAAEAPKTAANTAAVDTAKAV